MGETIATQGRGLALHNFDDAMRFATMVAGSEFAPKDFKGKPESCFLAMQHGAEVGLSPMQAVQNIACINGRPSIWGDAALALCLGSAVCDFVQESIEGEGDSMVAVCHAARRGADKATTARFSVADAKKAGLWAKTGPWSQYPKRMLQLRARGFALRDAFPDVLKGLVTAEEAQDYGAAETVKEPIVVRTRATPQRHPEPVARLEAPVEAANPTLFQKAMDKIQRAGDRETLEGCLNRIDELRRSGEMTAEDASKLIVVIDGRMDIFAQPVAEGDA